MVIRSYGGMLARSYGRTVTKTKFSRIDGLPYFITNGAPRDCLRHAELRYYVMC